MNNHWGTNYRAYQEGPTLFRFILRPHGPPDLPQAQRFAMSFSQPLLCARASATKLSTTSLLRVEPSDILVTATKPTDDGKGWIMRLFNAADAGGVVQENTVAAFGLDQQFFIGRRQQNRRHFCGGSPPTTRPDWVVRVAIFKLDPDAGA